MTPTTELASLPAHEDSHQRRWATRTASSAWADNAKPSPVNGDQSLASRTRHRAALLALGRALAAAGYDWVCPTPETQALVNARFPDRQAHDLCGVFGWNRPFSPDLLSQPLPVELMAALFEAGLLQRAAEGTTLRSQVRFSSFAGTLLVHSACPTPEVDAVVFGPDTYRFGAFVERELYGSSLPRGNGRDAARLRTVVDLGCGSGAGGILAARLLQADAMASPVQMLFTDVNARALLFAEVNAELAGLQRFECRHSDVLAAVPEPIDLVLASPPCLIDPLESVYHHGGGELGTAQAVNTVQQSLERLAPGGRLLLYAAAPVVKGVDVLWRALRPLLARAAAERHATHLYGLIDPDVCGSVLARPAYAQVDRLSLMGLSVRIPL